MQAMPPKVQPIPIPALAPADSPELVGAEVAGGVDVDAVVPDDVVDLCVGIGVAGEEIELAMVTTTTLGVSVSGTLPEIGTPGLMLELLKLQIMSRFFPELAHCGVQLTWLIV